MRLKIRCDGKSEKFCKIFWKLNKAQVTKKERKLQSPGAHLPHIATCRKRGGCLPVYTNKQAVVVAVHIARMLMSMTSSGTT